MIKLFHFSIAIVLFLTLENCYQPKDDTDIKSKKNLKRIENILKIDKKNKLFSEMVFGMTKGDYELISKYLLNENSEYLSTNKAKKTVNNFTIDSSSHSLYYNLINNYDIEKRVRCTIWPNFEGDTLVSLELSLYEYGSIIKEETLEKVILLYKIKYGDYAKSIKIDTLFGVTGATVELQFKADSKIICITFRKTISPIESVRIYYTDSLYTFKKKQKYIESKIKVQQLSDSLRHITDSIIIEEKNHIKNSNKKSAKDI
jgi:hypothetical protein